ncbi:MAG: flavin reductase family protein [Deltaproteobacteria bacterium]|nr:flavin reductase family protein [Deltaproteobacteria bacterium]
MQIDPKDHDATRLYQLMTSVIVPRPIAWVSTLSRDGVPNLAPFSFFSGLTTTPPLVTIAAGRRRGARKDTTNNASATRELVVNLVTEGQLDAMVKTSGEFPPEVDEIALAGLTPLPSVKVRPPRIAEAPVQLECKTREILELSPGIVDLIVAEIVHVHVADGIPVGEDLSIPTEALRPIARLGGACYTTLGTIVKVERPRT